MRKGANKTRGKMLKQKGDGMIPSKCFTALLHQRSSIDKLFRRCLQLAHYVMHLCSRSSVTVRSADLARTMKSLFQLRLAYVLGSSLFR